MLVRAVLPALFLCLFALPARADLAMPHGCSNKKEGEACRDSYSGGKPGQCMHRKCVIGSYEGEGDIEDYQYDCIRCTSPEQLALQQQEEATLAQARARQLRWGVAALGLGCVITFAWYDWRRRSKARRAGSAPTEGA